MFASANRYAKAIVAFAVPVAAYVTDVASVAAGITEDGIVGLNEWQTFALAVVSGLGVFFKANAPAPPQA